MLAHDLARALPVLEERGIGDLALQLGEALAFPLNQTLRNPWSLYAQNAPTVRGVSQHSA